MFSKPENDVFQAKNAFIHFKKQLLFLFYCHHLPPICHLSNADKQGIF